MIRKLLNRVFGRKGKRSQDGPDRVPASVHGIHRDAISPCARKVVTTLQEKGHLAFIVGGAVRDLLVGRSPKDFDVATDASPEQVHALFRRSRIIGRRFRLVHVMCGRETVEVSTFRSHHPEAGEDAGRAHADEHGRILRDNVYGSQQDDAERRDFTINALFYDPTGEEVWDYQGGIEDLKKKRLTIIGDAEKRYREDPVRMLRAVRFAASLGLSLDGPTGDPIPRLAELLGNVPASRLFDEMLKLLLSGHSVECVLELRRRGLHHGLLPMLDVILEQPLGERFVMRALETTDERVRADRPVSPAFLFAALLWHEVLNDWNQRQGAGEKPMPALTAAMDTVLGTQEKKLAIPRRYDAFIKETWMLQPRFVQRSGTRPARLLTHPRFRAAYDFMLLRCESGELEAAVGDWWTEFQDANDARRAEMLMPAEGPAKKRRRRSSRSRKGQGGAAPADTPESTD